MKKERVKRPVLIDNRYKTLKKLGSGAMGDVYKVRDLKDKRIIALKMLSKEKTSSDAVLRFKREFRLLAGLHHPNLCSVYDFGLLKDGRSYFTMEYIGGNNIFRSSEDLSDKKIYPWIVQLCRVLEYIHSKGLIHYDIKPSNVLIAEGKEQEAESKKAYTLSPVSCVKLLDFGLVGEQRINGGPMIKGTFPYIAPEVIKGLAIDHRADLYSLGVLLYEIFTRKALHVDRKRSLATLLRQQQEQIVKLPSKIAVNIPKSLERLVMRLLAFEPAERFSRANEIIREINKFSRSRFEFETEKSLEGYLLSSRFVGRTKEMTLLKSLYEQARQGEGKVVLVTGEAGIGKSRLLKEFKISAQLQRSHCFTGSAYRDKVGPLEPFYEIFKELINYIKFRSDLSRELKLSFAVLFKLFPDLADEHLKKKPPKLVPLEPKQEKLRTFKALSELIGHCASRLGELVILLEDLHWVDDLSIQFLEYLGRNLADRNIFICCASRKEELEENLVFKKIVTNLKKQNYFTQIELRLLKFRGLYSLLDSTITPGSNSSELVRYLMEKTGGNPFFVEEIMRTLLLTRKVSMGERVQVEDLKRISIPVTIENIVLKRIKVLDSASQKVVKFSAILLKDFSYDLMKQLTGLDDTELSRALWILKKRQVLIEEGNKYRFYHATLREAINKRMAYREKRKLYYQAGKTLEVMNRGRFEKVVEDLAYYFINARDRKKGVNYGLRAARKSSARYANEQAIRFYKGVHDLLDNKNPKLQFNILQELAGVEVLSSLYDDAIKHCNKILNMKVGAVYKRLKVCTKVGGVYAHIGEYDKALYIYRRGVRLLKKMKTSRLKKLLEADINVRICRVYQMIGNYKSVNKFNFDGLKFPKEGLKGKDAIGLQGSIYNTLALIEVIKGGRSKIHCDRAIFYYKKAYKYYKKIKDEDKIATILNNLGVVYRRKFDSQRAFDCYQKSTKIAEKRGFQGGVSTGLFNLGNILSDEGHYSKALGYFRRALSVSKKIGYPAVTGSTLLGIGVCYLQFCDYKKAKEYYEKALKIFDTIGWKERLVSTFYDIGSLYKAMGDYTLALQKFRKVLKISKDIEYQNGFALSFIGVGSLFIEIGEFSRAKKYLEDALNIATTVETKYIEIECYIHLCRLSMMEKNYVTAIDYHEKGIMLAKKAGMKQRILRFLLLASEIHYYEKKYLKGSKNVNKAIKLAKKMGAKDLYAKALLNGAKNEMGQGIMSEAEVIRLLGKAKGIAEEIGCPEVLWKVYFEYGRFLQDDKQYLKALDCYQKCNDVFEDVISKIKNESFKKSYLNRPDRKALFTITNELR